MNSLDSLAPFQRRVRLVLGLKAASMGLLCAAILCLFWSLLDARGIVYAEIGGILLVLAAGVTIGFLAGFLRAPSATVIAASLDRRANLKDRVASAISTNGDQAFAQELRQDAEHAIAELQPEKLYPIRWSWVHSAGLAVATAAIGFFLTSATFIPGTNSPEVKAAMKKEASRLATLKKAIFEDAKPPRQNPAELEKLQRDLQRLQKDYEKAKIDPKVAMLKQEELRKEAAKLTREKAQNALKDIQKAETALEKVQQQALKDAGIEGADMGDVNMSRADFDEKLRRAEKKKQTAQSLRNDLQKKLDALNQQLMDPKLSEEERKDLEKQVELTKAQLEQAKKAATEAQKQLANLKLSEQAREALEKMMNDPLMKEIQKELDRLREKLKSADQGDEDTMWQKPISKEEIEQMQKDIEEFLKEMADDDARKEYLEKLLESLKNAKEAGQCQKMGFGLGMGMGMGMGGPGPGPDNDRMLADTGIVNKSDPIQGKGSGQRVFAPTERDPMRPGPEMTFEIKAPTFKGTRSSIPYQQVLPSYKQKAESALKKKEIPKEHQDRVKRYFDSLSK